MACGAGSLKGDSQGKSLLLPVPHREHHDRGRLSMSSWHSDRDWFAQSGGPSCWVNRFSTALLFILSPLSS